MAEGITDRVKMNVSVGEEKISLKVDFDKQDAVRDTEAHINSLYDKWRKSFPGKSGPELLAMLAYQYASFYLEMIKREDDVVKVLGEFEKRIDSVLDAI